MAGFGQLGLTDYSGAAAAGGAFQGFAEALQNAQDRALRKQEIQAKLNATQAQVQREKDQTSIDAYKSHMEPDGQGGWRPRKLSPMEQAEQNLKAESEGLKQEVDENGNPTGNFVTDPNSPKMKGIAAQYGFRGAMIDQRNDFKDRAEHSQVVSAIQKNPNLTARLQQYQNLDNALNNLSNAQHITPQQFQEAQQTIRANLGIKGTSGVDERSSTFLKSMGLNAKNFQQFLTGSPSDMSPDDPFLSHIKDLAGLEQSNIRNQFHSAIMSAAGGHASMYKRRPDLEEDLKDLISRKEGQVAGSESESAPEQSSNKAAPSQESNGGLMGSIGNFFGGLVHGGNKDPHMEKAANMTPADRAARIKELEQKAKGNVADR